MHVLISENFCISVVAGLTAEVLFKVLPTNNAVYVYVIGWLAVVFGINSASIVNRKG